MDVAQMGEDLDAASTDQEILPHLTQDLRDQGASDNSTVATYSVFFYYTPEFADATPDIDSFITQVLAETNLGYEQSGVPLVATKFCQELATINDQDSASA